MRIYLPTETIKGSALALEGVDDVEGGDGLTFGLSARLVLTGTNTEYVGKAYMFGVGDGVTDDRFEEGLEDTAGLFVDHG